MFNCLRKTKLDAEGKRTQQHNMAVNMEKKKQSFPDCKKNNKNFDETLQNCF